jgi:hypothetical protein
VVTAIDTGAPMGPRRQSQLFPARGVSGFLAA